MKPHFNVVGAAILRDGKVLALRRSDGNESVIHKFEFVGGKVEEGETLKDALIRECREEISLEIEIGELLNSLEYEYSDCIVTLSVFFVKALSDYTLKVHEEERWIPCEDLDPADWAPADRQFLMTLKTGFLGLKTVEDKEGFSIIRSLSENIMHEVYDDIMPEGQIDYMLNLFLSDEAIAKNISENGYKYKLIYLNSELAGYCAYCPAKYYNPDLNEGTFLSKLYILEFARGKRITSRLMDILRRPVYLTVKHDNTAAINVYKHCGFKIVQSVSNDIGGGYTMDDFIMMLK